jgi:hypothetical protein
LDVLAEAGVRHMPPKIELGQALGYGMAKTREFLGK